MDGGGTALGTSRKENRQIKFRVSDSEYERLEQTANSFQMSVPAFAKKRAMGYRMKPPKVDKAGAIEIAKQLRAIGNNVNQLTRRANATNDVLNGEELPTAIPANRKISVEEAIILLIHKSFKFILCQLGKEI